jgi:cyclopropane-fatty-acyl-phospholipid synthase
MTPSERLLDQFVARLLTRGTLTLHHASGASTTHGTPMQGYADLAIRFGDSKVARDVLLDPRLGLGEAFMDGRFTVEQGDIMDLLSLIRANNPWEKKGRLAPPSPLRALTGKVKSALRAVNKPGSSKRNVAHHYDIGNELYRLMLDADHMQYSCAYFPADDMTLEQAQEAKLAHIAAKLNLAPGLHVLDVGCGWGGMAIFLASRAGVTVHGITLSEEQFALARTRAEAAGVADKVTFELVDYRDLAARGVTYDRIVSVGMFEHVGVRSSTPSSSACADAGG